MNPTYPHLPRRVNAAVAAVLLAVLALLLLAPRIGDVSFGSGGSARASAPPPAASPAPVSSWLRNPFTPGLGAPVSLPAGWRTGAR